MTSHLVMKDAGISLRQQALELKAIPSDTIRTDELLSSLGMSHVLTFSIQIRYTPADYSGPDQVTNMVSDLVPQLDKFSTRICMEKEIMTHALRTFVEMHTMTIISSDYEDLTLPSILIFPAIHLMRVIGQLSLWPWLPEVKLYSFQVRPEIQFHKKQLIDGIKAAPDIFDVNPPSTHLFQNSSSQRIYLEGAIDTVTIHQQSIRQIIDGSGSSLWRWIRGAEKTAKLERYHELGERVRGHLLTVKETMNEYEIYYRRKQSNLQEFRQSLEKSPLIEYSAQSSSAVPPPLLAQVRNVFLLSRGQSSKIDEVGDSRNATHVTSHPHVFLNHLDPIDDDGLSSLRSEIAQLCKVQNNIMINSDDLHTICVIYNLVATMSALDDDPLSDFQTSWMVVRAEVIHRWQQRMGFDLESVLRHFAKKYKDYKHGTPVLEHI